MIFGDALQETLKGELGDNIHDQLERVIRIEARSSDWH